MALFNFIKDFFRKEEKKDIEIEGSKFSLADLEKWLNDNTQEVSSTFKSEIDAQFQRISEGIRDIDAGLRELENFNIEREINERARTMIIQNKENYIKSTQRLLEFFNSGIKTEKSIKKIEDFVKLALWEIDLFSRQTTRSFQISSSIIGKEFERVLIGLKKINRAVLDMKTMDKTNERLSETARNLISEIKSSGIVLGKLDSMKEENEKKINDFKKDIEGLKGRERGIRSSREWKQKEELREKIEKFEKEQEEKQVELKNLFMNIEKLIQKYAWNRKNKEILMYVEDTISALREDDGLKILNDIDNMRKDIEENVYTSDEERKKAFMESLNRISERVLRDFLDSDMKYENDLKKMREELKGIKIEELNYDEIYGKIGERDEENLKIEKKKKMIIEEIAQKKKGLTLLVEDIGKKIGKDLRVSL